MSAPVLEAKASFALRGHNPDVLTCIANLSNDEVFTPPELANQMLDTVANAWAVAHDGAVIWENPDVTFLDPFTKSGVFLREITRRLTEGLAEWEPDLEKRVDHILTRQVYGIGITQLTALLARRSVYCSKEATGEHSIAKSFDRHWGNIWFERTEHTWAGDRCAYCGAAKAGYERGDALESHAYAFIHSTDPRALLATMFGADVQFDVIIGNPPYQLGESGGESVGGFAMPIYQRFVRSAKELGPRFAVLVTPSRWFAGGRGLDEFRTEMLTDRRLRALVDFPDASEAFPGTQIKGGVSYFLWDSTWDGDCRVSTIEAGRESEPLQRRLDAYDVLVRRNQAVAILEKVRAVAEQDGVDMLSARVSAIQPFSLRTTFKGEAGPEGLRDPIRLIGNGGSTFIERSAVPRNHDWVDQWKVLLGAAYGAGDSVPHQIYNYPIIAEPGTACTETYLVIDHVEQQEAAVRLAAYLRTRLVRFLVSLRKYTQHLYNERFAFVPQPSADRVWTDADLYEKYGSTEEEIAFIESMVRPMEIASAEA